MQAIDISSPFNHTGLQRGRATVHERLIVQDSNRLIKIGIWSYFLLLIFEGALRKWFLPGLSLPLLVIRDPIALYLIFLTWKKGLLPSNIYLGGMVCIGILSIYTAVLFGHGNIPVALYGARMLLIHFPLMFVIGRIFTHEDVVKIGRLFLWISIPMAFLIAVQFYSPQSAWVNRGVGGDIGGAGFQGAMGFFRPPATFSFTSGTHLFFGLVASFAFYFWLTPKSISRPVLILATLGLVAAVPLSISRSLFFHVAISLLFAIFAISQMPKFLSRIIVLFVGGLAALAVLSQTSFFQTATEVFFSRFEQASVSEGGLEGTLGERYFGNMFVAVINSFEKPLMGYGIGMGTNVGSMLLTGGLQYLIAEQEWARILGESGPLMGLGIIILRLGLCVKIGKACYQQLKRQSILPWMLLSYGLLVIPNGQWAQPTILGFSTLIGGLMIASLRQAAAN